MLKCYYGLTLPTEACIRCSNWPIPQPYFRDESEWSVGRFLKRSQTTSVFFSVACSQLNLLEFSLLIFYFYISGTILISPLALIFTLWCSFKKLQCIWIHTVWRALWLLDVYCKVRKLKLVVARLSSILHICISIVG